MRLKSFHIKLLNILLILAFCLCCLYSCVSPALAVEEETGSSAVEVISTSETNLDAEILAQLEIITDLLAEEHEPVEGEITQAQFKAYVMGCLLFFVIVILAYFACKFFGMFF